MTQAMFLTRDQVKQLTGTADKKRQSICLKNNGIPYTLDVFGRPVVTVASVEGRKQEKIEQAKEDFLPSFLRAA